MATKEHVVILVHGIRDFALWQSEIRDTLRKHGFKVEPTNYGRFNLFKFLTPLGIFRRQALEDIETQVKIVRNNNKNSEISIIAHSFGTYVVAHLLQKSFDMKFHRIIFCGSVLGFRFPFQQFQQRFRPPILNEVGTKDIWPAIAQSVTFGYGNSGSYGFRRPLVEDRWHQNAHHGYFLNAEFCEKYWVPFLKTGEIVPGDKERSPQGPLVQLASIFQVKYFVVAALAVLLWCLFSGSDKPREPEVVPSPRAGLFCSSSVLSSSPAYFDFVDLNLSECKPGNESGSRAFLVRYESNRSGGTFPQEIPGYSRCFDSDFFERAPIVDASIRRTLEELKDRVSCEVSARVLRVIKMGYVNQDNESKSVAYVQRYSGGSPSDITIDQVPFTSAARSEDLEQVEFSTSGRFDPEDILEQVRRFGYPGQPVEIGKFGKDDIATGWVFVGYTDKKTGAFREGPHIRIAKTNNQDAKRFVDLGDHIDLTRQWELIIKNYKNVPGGEPLASPTSIPGGVIRSDDRTGVLLPSNTRWVVAVVKSAGFSKSEVDANWVRVRELPQ